MHTSRDELPVRAFGDYDAGGGEEIAAVAS